VSSGYVATIILIILLVAGPVIGVIIKGTLENRTRESMKRDVDQKTQRESDIAYWKAVALDSDSSLVQVDVAVRYLADFHGVFVERPSVLDDEHFHPDCRCLRCYERRKTRLGRSLRARRLSAQRDRAV